MLKKRILSCLLALLLMLNFIAITPVVASAENGADPNSTTPAKVTTDMTGGNNEHVKLITSDKYYIMTDSNGSEKMPFILELDGFTTNNCKVVLSTDTPNQTENFKILKDFPLFSDSTGQYSYACFSDISELVKNNSATFYVSIWDTSVANPKMMYSTSQAITVPYLQDDDVSVEDGSYIYSGNTDFYITLGLPCAYQDSDNYMVELVDKDGISVAKTINDTEMSNSNTYINYNLETRYSDVFQLSSSLLQSAGISNYYCNSNTRLYCIEQLKEGTYGIKISKDDNEPVLYKDLITVVNSPVVTSLGVEDSGYPPVVPGGDTAYIHVNAYGATNDSFKISIEDKNNNVLGSSSSGQFKGENQLLYKIRLNDGKSFTQNTTYKLVLTPTNPKDEVFFSRGNIANTSIYPRSDFTAYDIQFNDAKNVASYTLKTVNPPSDNIEIGLFSNDNQGLNKDPIATTTVKPSESMNVEFRNNANQPLTLEDGSYYLKYLKNNYWYPLRWVNVNTNSSNGIGIGSTYFYIDDTAYNFKLYVPADAFNLNAQSSYSVSLLDSKDKKLLELSNDKITPEDTNWDEDVGRVKLSGIFDLSSLSDKPIAGTYKLKVTVTNGTASQSSVVPISGLDRNCYYANSNPQLTTKKVSATLYNVPIIDPEDKTSGGYDLSKFSLFLKDLNGKTMEIPATATVKNIYDDTIQINLDTDLSDSLKVGYYKVALQYKGSDIYSCYDPTQLLFSGYNLYHSVSATPKVNGYYYSSSNTIYGLSIYEESGSNHIFKALLYTPSKYEPEATITLEKNSTSGLFEFTNNTLENINTSIPYSIAVIADDVCIGWMNNVRVGTQSTTVVDVSGITLDKTSMTLKVGQSETLIKTISPANASDKSAAWTSSNPDVAKVDLNGKVTAIGVGTATVSVTTKNGLFNASCAVTVEKNTASIGVSSLAYSDKTAIAPNEGSSVYTVDGTKFTAGTTAAVGNPLKLTIRGDGYTADTLYKVSVLCGETASVYSKGSIKGSDLSNANGYCIDLEKQAGQADGNHIYKIVVSTDTTDPLQSEQIANGSFTLTISGTPVPVTGISLNKSNATMSVGKTMLLSATITPTNATNKNISWSSSNESVATVGDKGVVTAVAGGTTIITATTSDGSKKATCTVSVLERITGTLMYGSKEKTPCPNTWISLYDAQDNYVRGISTSNDGSFSIPDVIGGSYTLRASAPNNSYNALNKAVTIGKDQPSSLGEIYFESRYEHNAALTINISALQGKYQIYLYGSDIQYWNYKEGSTNSITFDNVPYSTGGSQYTVSLYDTTTGYYSQQQVSLSSDTASVDFTIPKLYTISGTLKDEDSPVANETVMATTSGKATYYGYTDANGSYTIRGLSSGDYTVGLPENSPYSADKKDVKLEDANKADVNLTASKGLTLYGTASNTTPNGSKPYKAYLSLYDDKQNTIAYATAGADGSYVMSGAIKSAGDYTVKITYLCSENSASIPFVAEEKKFALTADDIKNGGNASINVSYSDPTKKSEIFTGNENLVLTDTSVVRCGSLVNLIIKYKNNGNSSVDSATFTATLPTGVTIASGDASFTIKDLTAGASGQKTIALNIGNTSSKYLNIPVKVQIASDTYDLGTANLEVANVTLSGTSAVNTGTAFKVYGEATEGSAILIKNAETGAVLASAKPSGRWYSAEIKLDTAGTYRLVAEATAAGATAKSDTLTVVAADHQISVKSVSHNGYTLSLNQRIGVYTFSTYVNSALVGRDIPLSVSFNNGDEISSVVFNFSDKQYTATKNGSDWKATLNNWSGAGLKTITATVTTSNGKTLTFTIAEVTVLVDPSGIIKDAETGKALEGVTVTCEVWNHGTWETWDAESYGQSNPLTSDANGYYGWMVPTGKYRVLAYKDGYLPYDSTKDTSNTKNNTITIPPARTDVDFNMEPSVRVTSLNLDQTSVSLTVAGTKSLTATINPDNATNAGKVIWSSSNTSVASVTNKGVITAVAAGTTNITATCGGKTATCAVTVAAGGSSSGGSSSSSSSNSNPSSTSSQSIALKTDNTGVAIVSKKDLQKANSLTIQADAMGAKLTFDSKAVNTLAAAGADLTISVKQVDKASLSAKDSETIGNRPVYNFTAKAGNTTISDFKGGCVAVSIPYALQAGEDPNSIVVYYIDAEGKLNVVCNGRYDAQTKSVVFNTTHFSIYAVGYHHVSFHDVDSSAWYYNAIEFIAARSITNGTSDGSFAPDSTLTRGQFIVMLMRAYGLAADEKPSDNFVDAGNTYYTNYLAAAKRLGITQGIGNNTYAPDKEISRQDMFTLLYRALDVLGEMPNTSNGKSILDFKDNGQVANYAKTAINSFVSRGIISGSSGNLNPSDTTTRAEMAQVFLNLFTK